MDGSERRSPWARAIRYLREVRAELGKVVWPTRRELVVYSIVVIVTVVLLGAFVFGLDVLFTRLIVKVLGDP